MVDRRSGTPSVGYDSYKIHAETVRHSLFDAGTRRHGDTKGSSSATTPKPFAGLRRFLFATTRGTKKTPMPVVGIGVFTVWELSVSPRLRVEE